MAHRVEPGRTARIDTLRAVVARGEGRLDDAEKLAAVAVRSAEHTGAPDLHCEALLVHGRCVRGRSLEDAERSLDAGPDIGGKNEPPAGMRFRGY